MLVLGLVLLRSCQSVRRAFASRLVSWDWLGLAGAGLGLGCCLGLAGAGWGLGWGSCFHLKGKCLAC